MYSTKEILHVTGYYTTQHVAGEVRGGEVRGEVKCGGVTAAQSLWCY